MDSELRGFETKPLTLLVGPGQHKLYISQSVLSQIPFFEQAVIANETTNPGDKGFEMPEFDPRALADIIYYFWTKAVPDLGTNAKAGCKTNTRETVNARVKAYVVAQKLALGRMQKRIERQLVLYHQIHDIDPNNLILLLQAGLQDSILYKFIMAEVGYLFSKNSLSKLDSRVAGFTSVCETMPRELLWDFLKATDCGYDLTAEEQPSKQASWLNDSIPNRQISRTRARTFKLEGTGTRHRIKIGLRR